MGQFTFRQLLYVCLCRPATVFYFILFSPCCISVTFFVLTESFRSCIEKVLYFACEKTSSNKESAQNGKSDNKISPSALARPFGVTSRSHSPLAASCMNLYVWWQKSKCFRWCLPLAYSDFSLERQLGNNEGSHSSSQEFLGITYNIGVRSLLWTRR